MKLGDHADDHQWDTRYPAGCLAAIDPAKTVGAKIWRTDAPAANQVTVRGHDGLFFASPTTNTSNLSTACTVDGDVRVASGLASCVST